MSAISTLSKPPQKRKLTLGGILRVRTLHNRINRATLLTVPAKNTLCHVDIVPRGAAAAVLALLGFDGDGLCGTDCFAQFAGDAAFFAGGVAAEGVLAAEAGGDGAFFEGVVYRVAVGALVSRSCTFMALGARGFFREGRVMEHCGGFVWCLLGRMLDVPHTAV